MIKNLIILFTLVAGLQVAQSQNNVPVFRFIWNEANYLFYDTYDLQQLQFQYSGDENQIKNAAEKVDVIERIETGNGSGTLYFKANPDPSDIRKFAEKAGYSEIFVNSTRILTSCLLNKIELADKSRDNKVETKLFNSASNKIGSVENIKFNIDFFSSKLYLMQTTNYPSYLYKGYVTEYTEKLAGYKEQLSSLNKKN